MLGKAIPSWLLHSGPVLLRRFVRNKGDPLCDEVELLEANPNFAHIKYPDGRESTVSTRDLPPCPINAEAHRDLPSPPPEASPAESEKSADAEASPVSEAPPDLPEPVPDVRSEPRRSERIRKQPDRFGVWVSH